jgi:cation diffusion facilitator CzcD-associated flavoprotein CzcO
VQLFSLKLVLTMPLQSVAVIGSANTAFDVMADCYDAGLKTTIVARSPTYVLPYDYVMDHRAVGIYDVVPLDKADKLMNALPFAVDGQLSHGLLAHLASQEP